MARKKKSNRWQDKLTKKELKHVLEWGGRTLTGFKHNRETQITQQKEMKAKGYYNDEPCWTCKQIAGKLGLET